VARESQFTEDVHPRVTQIAPPTSRVKKVTFLDEGGEADWNFGKLKSWPPQDVIVSNIEAMNLDLCLMVKVIKIFNIRLRIFICRMNTALI
jgi:hypothetical protein